MSNHQQIANPDPVVAVGLKGHCSSLTDSLTTKWHSSLSTSQTNYQLSKLEEDPIHFLFTDGSYHQTETLTQWEKSHLYAKFSIFSFKII